MGLWGWGRWTALIGAVILASGCEGQTGSPVPTSTTASATARQRPESTDDLLYLAARDGSGVQVMTYPEHQPLGALRFAGTPSWVCSDKAGNVWVTNAAGPNIYEYAHGRFKSKAMLRVTGHTFSQGCSVNPLTGDLAVTAGEDVIVFKDGRGTGKSYGLPFASSDCAYDLSGNLFALASSGTLQIVELKQGSGYFETITLDKPAKPDGSGGINWDGKYMTVSVTTDQRHLIYRFKMTGTIGKVVGTVHLAEEQKAAQYWVAGKTIVSELRGWETVGVWQYPHGGSPEIIINQGPFGPLTISAAPSH